MAVEREFGGLGVERFAVMEFVPGPQLDRHLLAVGGGLMRQRQLRHDVELLVDVEQLVAECREYDAADIGARHGRVEDIGILAKPDAQRGLGLSPGPGREQQRRRSQRHTQDLHRTDLHLQTPAEGMGSTISTPDKSGTSAAELKAATNRASAGERLSAGTRASGGGSSATR